MQAFSEYPTVTWLMQDGVRPDHLGMIPLWINGMEPLRHIINFHYAHGGGWRPTSLTRFKLVTDCTVEEWRLEYPEDPPMKMLAYCRNGDEMFIIFEYAWCAIVAADGTYEICRID